MKESYFSTDTLDMMRLFGKHNVKYVIVGGEAVIFYGYSRLTGDIDIYYEISEFNSINLFNALKEFWGGSIPGISSAAEFLISGEIIQFGQPPNRIDLINAIDGIQFKEVWESRVEQEILTRQIKIKTFYIGLESLIKNKTASGRYKDLDDLRFLVRLNQQNNH